MEPRIENVGPKVLVGLHREMTLVEDATHELWRAFMPRRHEIQGRTTNEYISMQVYPRPGASALDPSTTFTKWAVVEVTEAENLPPGMRAYTLQGGVYAVFLHRGPASAFLPTFQYIFGEWLPRSGYELDPREHFEVLPEGYDPRDSDASEQVYVPVRRPHA